MWLWNVTPTLLLTRLSTIWLLVSYIKFQPAHMIWPLKTMVRSYVLWRRTTPVSSVMGLPCIFGPSVLISRANIVKNCEKLSGASKTFWVKLSIFWTKLVFIIRKICLAFHLLASGIQCTIQWLFKSLIEKLALKIIFPPSWLIYHEHSYYNQIRRSLYVNICMLK